MRQSDPWRAEPVQSKVQISDPSLSPHNSGPMALILLVLAQTNAKLNPRASAGVLMFAILQELVGLIWFCVVISANSRGPLTAF
jgi:hypothetical protein